MKDIGFILSRHVKDVNTDRYWLEACRCIRNIYPEIPIVIIDDNSDYSYVTPNTFDDCIVIQSEFPARGELLPYYYMYTKRLFKKAIIIHDSVFLQSPIQYENVKNVCFLWDFNMSDGQIFNESIELINKHLPIQMSYENYTSRYRGCFGVQSIISFDFLEVIEAKYNFLNMIKSITSRRYRMALERLFAICCYETKYSIDIPICGDILKQSYSWGQTFDDYKSLKVYNTPFVKVWTGR